MADIETLIPDIYSLFEKDVKIDKEVASAFGQKLGQVITARMSELRGRPTLRLSNLGTPCDRKLWYTIRAPELAEPLSAPTRIKFLIGDILEELVLFLSRLAGHSVTDEQKEVSVGGVPGHIDGKIDGVVSDVKSASPYSFMKFRNGLTEADDSFGYLTQLGTYVTAENGDRGAFVAIDKSQGNLTLDMHERPEIDYVERTRHAQQMLALPHPPERGYTDVPDGKSGNRKLGIVCSYCGHKSTCWPRLRQYNYARGPVYLTVVVREPRVEAE